MTVPATRGLITSKAQFNVAFAGRRSYKTETRKRKLILGDAEHHGGLTLPHGRFFYAAPTQKQAKRIAWSDLCVMTQPYWAKKPNNSELTIFLNNGAELVVLGMDQPARIEGSIWDGGVLDEFDDMKDGVWEEHVQPITSDTNAWIDFIGVPEGRKKGYELAMQARDDESGDWAFWTWHSSLFLPAKSIERARRDLDDRTFKQEYEAEFNTLSGVAYYTFDDDNIQRCELKKSSEIYLCYDFNAGEKPMAVGVCQIEGDMVRVVKEFVFDFSNTQATTEAVDVWLNEQGFNGTIKVTGDYAGRRRESNASFSDYEIIGQFFKNRPGYKVKTRPTLSIRDRVASTNTRLRSGDGRIRMLIDPSCERLIKDFREVEWNADGSTLNGKNTKLTHISDAVSYLCYNEFAIDHKRARRSR